MALYTKERLEELFKESRMKHKPKPKQPTKRQTEQLNRLHQLNNDLLWQPRDSRWIDEEWPTEEQLRYLKAKIKLKTIPNLKLRTTGMKPKGQWERALKEKTLDEDECDIIRMWCDSMLHQLIINRRRKDAGKDAKEDNPQGRHDER